MCTFVGGSPYLRNFATLFCFDTVAVGLDEASLGGQLQDASAATVPALYMGAVGQARPSGLPSKRCPTVFLFRNT